MLKLTFHQTNAEMMVRVASTLLFNGLIKSGCPVARLAELTSGAQYGYTESASASDIGPKFVRITDLKAGRIDWETVPYCKCSDSEKYLLEDKDLLFARTGATTGKTHLVKTPPFAVFASYLIRVRPKTHVMPEYLYSFFQSDDYWLQISESKEGSAQPNVNGRKLLSISVPIVDTGKQMAIIEFMDAVRARQEGHNQPLPDLPAPLNGQRRIVSRIEDLGAKVREARKLRESSLSEAKALVASEANKTVSDAQELGWPEVSLGDVAEIRSGVTLGRRLKGPTVRLPYLRVANVQDGHLDLSVIKEVEILPSEAQKWRLTPGDVLLTEGGDWDKLGRGTVWRGEIPHCIHQNHIFRVRTSPSEFDSDFVATIIGSPYGKAYFQAASKQTTNLASINQRQLKAFKIFQPSLDVQRTFVEQLRVMRAKMDNLRNLQSQTTAELDALMPSILSKAFRGEL